MAKSPITSNMHVYYQSSGRMPVCRKKGIGTTILVDVKSKGVFYGFERETSVRMVFGIDNCILGFHGESGQQ
jgi:hypothetical protein